MMIFAESARTLKRYLAESGLSDTARMMVIRVVLGFILHRGRMSCSSAAGVIASESIHRGQLTRFLARCRWQKSDIHEPLRTALLHMESRRGRFLFILDATMFSQAGKKTQNTYSTGNRQRRPRKGRRYNTRKVHRKHVHSFTFGLLITPSGYRIPFQIPHYTKEYCEQKGRTHRTTAEAAAELIRDLPLSEGADVFVLGDTAYDAQVVRAACAERGYEWIFPANPERVYEGKKGQRLKLRARLSEWAGLSLCTVRLHPSTGRYADYRRISRYRLGPKQKPRVYHAFQEQREVRSVGRVLLVFSTMKSHRQKATPDTVRILMTSAVNMSVSEVIELYSLRWQIELFFKELKSTLGVGHYQFQRFEAVEGWIHCALTTVLFLEHERARRLSDRRFSEERRQWWQTQRLHGLCEAFRQECTGHELKYLSDRLKTSGGIKKVQRLLTNALPMEFRENA